MMCILGLEFLGALLVMSAQSEIRNIWNHIVAVEIPKISVN